VEQKLNGTCMKKIVFNCKEGTVTEVELTPEELLTMQSESIVWHKESKLFRVKVNNDTGRIGFKKIVTIQITSN
jgi:uncharacterized protein (AIM24 family)